MIELDGIDTSRMSMEQQVALLSPIEQERVLAAMDLAKLKWSWKWTARPDQLQAVESLARIIAMLAGRGAGKTRTGAEWVRRKVSGPKPVRIALVGRTSADVRDVMVRGDSGLLTVFPPSERPKYVENARKVTFANGSEALCFSAIEPGQLRGPQFDYSWADELAAWNLIPDEVGLTAWDNLEIATRLGLNPQIFVSTTPKRVPIIRELHAKGIDPSNLTVELLTASTFDNPHLAQVYFDVITGLYAGTRLGAQELYARILDAVDGALWTDASIEGRRDFHSPGNLPFRVVGVDPSVADKPRDECGIIVMGATGERRPTRRTGYVLADRSVHGPPSVWAKAVVKAANDFDAIVVAEANQGGALVREVIHGQDPKVRVRLVHAKVGKSLRAEPVTLAYDQGRVVHVGRFPELEDQMTTWIPGETKDSPDRVDGLVHAATGLVTSEANKVGGRTSASNPGRRAGPLPTGASSVVGRVMSWGR